MTDAVIATLTEKNVDLLRHKLINSNHKNSPDKTDSVFMIYKLQTLRVTQLKIETDSIIKHSVTFNKSITECFYIITQPGIFWENIPQPL